jgi:hypothetical protein
LLSERKCGEKAAAAKKFKKNAKKPIWVGKFVRIGGFSLGKSSEYPKYLVNKPNQSHKSKATKKVTN